MTHYNAGLIGLIADVIGIPANPGSLLKPHDAAHFARAVSLADNVRRASAGPYFMAVYLYFRTQRDLNDIIISPRNRRIVHNDSDSDDGIFAPSHMSASDHSSR